MVDRKTLVDSNIFIEILLRQKKEKECSQFVYDNFETICISQFALNSVALICFRNKKYFLFNHFLTDIASHIPVLTLTISDLLQIDFIISHYGLDYDDAYQYIAAKSNNLEITTLDADFKKVQTEIKINFL